MVGWRIIEATLTYGAEAGIGLVDDVAREVARFSDNEVFAGLGEGLAARCESTTDSLQTVASYCLTLAFIGIRGGGGWRTFAGRERVHLWTAAYELDPVTAARTLAEVAGRVLGGRVPGHSTSASGDRGTGRPHIPGDCGP
jgi:hypothetical protein